MLTEYFVPTTWLESVSLPYYSPHKFRHGHIQYGLARSETVADYKAVSMNVMHASMEITDQTYSNINDGEVQNRISGLNKDGQSSGDGQELLDMFKEFLNWKGKKKK